MNANRKSKIENPKLLWLVRHGESTANVARHKAERDNLPTINFPEPEADVPLSETGEKQSVRIGNWFAKQTEKPTVVFCSPYVRACETARIVLSAANFDNLKINFDERLRERELGIFDRLTKRGATEKFPAECAERERLGKFYYRPPNGENWADVGERVKSFWRDAKTLCSGENVLIVTHEAVIHLFRYVLENLSEAEILAIDRACDIENCAITKYRFDGANAILETDNVFPAENQTA
ncbi:MAG: histidine phosphatase family protein [Acidobacteriota bacterium]|nr:histidine phosphatase family protein [Acidobacteriota bacterium]